MAEKRPMAFMSYAHIDDRFNKGYLSEFCQCLSGEVCLHLGEEFPIFLDRKDIKWGDSWKERIRDSIDSTTFLILIITPGFFRSQHCRDELSRFLERERRLKRDDLILPIYFIDTPLLEDERKRNQDDLAQSIASRQYADWRKLRFTDLGSGEVRQALAGLAAQIRNALDAMPQTSDGDSTKIENKVQIHHEAKPSAAARDEKIEVRIVKMPAEVRETLEKQKPVPIATASKSGTPNVVFVGLMKIIDDETIMLADNFFYKTAQNLAENPKISILCYNGDTKKSFQIKGNVTVTHEGPDFDSMRAWVHGINRHLPAKSCAVVKITEIYDAMWGPAAGKQVA